MSLHRNRAYFAKIQCRRCWQTPYQYNESRHFKFWVAIPFKPQCPSKNWFNYAMKGVIYSLLV